MKIYPRSLLKTFASSMHHFPGATAPSVQQDHGRNPSSLRVSSPESRCVAYYRRESLDARESAVYSQREKGQEEYGAHELGHPLPKLDHPHWVCDKCQCCSAGIGSNVDWNLDFVGDISNDGIYDESRKDADCGVCQCYHGRVLHRNIKTWKSPKTKRNLQNQFIAGFLFIQVSSRELSDTRHPRHGQ